MKPTADILESPVRDDASFRDPSGHVFLTDNRVFRTVTAHGRKNYEFVRDTSLLDALADRDLLVATHEIDVNTIPDLGHEAAYVLEHDKLPWIAFPYEWPFEALRKAALLHLDIQLMALEYGVTLSDASAYNIQFIGSNPIFIDVLSFRRYHDGEFWLAHRQFCEQFLNPLLLNSILGIPYHDWYRGSLEGIGTDALNKMLRLRHKLSWNVLSNVTLQAVFQRAGRKRSTENLKAISSRKLPLARYRSLLHSLRHWVSKIDTGDKTQSIWKNYSYDNTYSDEEASLKHQFIHKFSERIKPKLAIDLGCNTGEFSETMLRSGAQYVVGFDMDHGALRNAFQRSEVSQLKLQPLYQDAANPSPNQGWRGRERRSLEFRGRPDALLALAFEHHLAIGRNIPLRDVVDWLTSLAPHGVIEFVQKSDPTIEKMLALRQDIFYDYSEVTFSNELARIARIVDKVQVSESGRVLYWYERASQ